MTPDTVLTSLEPWIAAQLAAGVSAADVAGACARNLARAYRLPLSQAAPSLLRLGTDLDVPDDIELTPWDLGPIYERALDDRHRHSHGVHYTPASVARRLVAIALEGADDAVEVCDPAVGGGVFLLAAAAALHERGVPRHRIVREQLWGLDIDPVAVQVADAALGLWGSENSDGWVRCDDHLVCADTLVLGLEAFDSRGRGFDVVVGNSPFQNQLGSSTARSSVAGQKLRSRWNVAAGPYADTAAFFLLAGLELAGGDGVVVLVSPQSVLVAGDSELIRRRLTSRAALTGLWVADRGVFDAGVRVCAPVLRVGAASGAVRRWTGGDVSATAEAASVPSSRSWSPLVADILGVPPVAPRSAGVLGDTCSATAGFRDQFYGLARHTVEREGRGDAFRPLLTVGMIDPLRNRWGTGPFKYHGERWTEPAVDMASLEAADKTLARWVRDREVPKLLVGTQTKVIEVVVDEAGEFVASTPVIAVVPEPERLWHIAAALTSPTLSAVAFLRAAGAALSADTLKLSARQLLALPVPFDTAAWDEGARLAKVAAGAEQAEHWEAALDELGIVMGHAYELGDDAGPVLTWWRSRRPAWRQ